MENSAISTSTEAVSTGGRPLIIFGAGIVGEVLLHACREAGIPVECFCDNNSNKTNSYISGLKILHPDDLKTVYKDAHFLISAADIGDVVGQLNDLGYSHWDACTTLLRNVDLSRHTFSAPSDFVEYAVDTCLLCHDSYVNPDKLFLRSVDLIITERCSLKCRDCSNLMQYYQKPSNSTLDKLLKSIDAFCGSIDEVNEFRIIGGEPFMNRDFDLVVKKLIEEPKVKRVVIYTNGTIMPSTEKLETLKNDKVILMITDYGVLSGKLGALTEALKHGNVAFYTRKAQGWSDCARICRHDRTDTQQQEIFKLCCAKNLATLSEGMLYRCPFSANADRLRAIPDYPNDRIDILDTAYGELDFKAKKNIIKTFLLNRVFLDVCDYCDGRPLGAPEIRPAIQTDKPLEYISYERSHERRSQIDTCRE